MIYPDHSGLIPGLVGVSLIDKGGAYEMLSWKQKHLGERLWLSLQWENGGQVQGKLVRHVPNPLHGGWMLYVRLTTGETREVAITTNTRCQIVMVRKRHQLVTYQMLKHTAL